MVREKSLANKSGKPIFQKLSQAVESAATLGMPAIWHYAQYQMYIKSGAAQRLKPTQWAPNVIDACLDSFRPLFIQPSREELASLLSPNQDILLKEADELCAGQFHPFGGPAQALRLTPPKPLLPWTRYDSQLNGEDIKFWWEPARMGWVFVLGRAYTLTGNENYAATCLRYLLTFIDDNPPYTGPNWASAQEAALRIPAVLFALQIFRSSQFLTKDIQRQLVQSILVHAERIPPTLNYARAQRNNHLLSEALGLVLTATSFPTHPKSGKWLAAGELIFSSALLDQIDPETGEYIQHSVNYHRLMLHLALLWSRSLTIRGKPVPQDCSQRLTLAAFWLKDWTDPVSGQAANLGHNDGSNLLRLDTEPIDSYRPIFQLATCGFSAGDLITQGPWDEPLLWLGLAKPPGQPDQQSYTHSSRLDSHRAWASIRAVKFTSRPAHADQTHLDLWLDGLNLAGDAGTYLYNGDPPWDNGLASALVHNTITVEDRDPMLKAGRFRWLRWSSAVVQPPAAPSGWLQVSHQAAYGGWKHIRDVCWTAPDRLVIIDHVTLRDPKPQRVTLHWLLVDEPWEWQEPTLILRTQKGKVNLTFSARVDEQDTKITCQIIRAGETQIGGDKAELFGWRSPTYGVRVPALSVRISSCATRAITLQTTWQLPSLPLLD